MPQVERIAPGEDTVRILVTTDNHVGFNEQDGVRGDDSWKTFEEIMTVGRERQVDLVLQCGDLFHTNTPSKKSLYNVVRTLRRTVMGDRPVQFEVLSDPSVVFDDGFNTVNYEDPNLNVSLPVFAINGNHDDQSGKNLLSPLDLLSSTGLLNYFGKVTQSDSIDVRPLLLQKGCTKISLFGLSNVKDERLFKSFRDGRVRFSTSSVRQREWFNLMCVHQNHHAHTNTSYLPEHFLPSFLDLVVWGHEHECVPYTTTNVATGTDILQPGSSIATSLSRAEAGEKCVFILSINRLDYCIEPVRLTTVRPFVYDEISLASFPHLRTGSLYKNEVTVFLIDKINELIEQARAQAAAQGPSTGAGDTLPLVRLRCDYSGGYEVENPTRFSNRFIGKVANVNSIVQFYCKKSYAAGARRGAGPSTTAHDDPDKTTNIQSLVNSYLKNSELSLLPEVGLSNAVRNFIDKDDKAALKDFIEEEMQSEFELLVKSTGRLDIHADLKSVLGEIKRERRARATSSEPGDSAGLPGDAAGLPGEPTGASAGPPAASTDPPGEPTDPPEDPTGLARASRGSGGVRAAAQPAKPKTARKSRKAAKNDEISKINLLMNRKK